MKRVISENSNCLDVGCHKGEILSIILSLSKSGKNFGFEPIPSLFKQLKEKFKNRAIICPYALADKNENSTFQVVKNALAYSGIKKRKYDLSNPDIEEIDIELKRADDIIPADLKIDFIKIDVEGGEFGVLKGAERILKESKPYVIFECGLGGSDYYDTNPAELYQYITETAELHLSTLSSFIKGKKELSQEEFESDYHSNKEYYFIAHP